jgi:hypothetical protein
VQEVGEKVSEKEKEKESDRFYGLFFIGIGF